MSKEKIAAFHAAIDYIANGAMTPYDLGYHAARSSVGEACPYRGYTPGHIQWVAGYVDGREQQARDRVKAQEFHSLVRVRALTGDS